MSESQLRFLQHLREFGLVYQRKVSRTHTFNRPFGVRICSFLTGPLASESAAFWQALWCQSLPLSDRPFGVRICSFLTGPLVSESAAFWQALWCQNLPLSDRPFGVRVCSFLTGPLVSVCSFLTGPLVSESATFWQGLWCQSLQLSDGTLGLTSGVQQLFSLSVLVQNNGPWSIKKYSAMTCNLHGYVKHKHACLKQKGPCLEQLWMLLQHALRGCTWQTTCYNMLWGAVPDRQHVFQRKSQRYYPTRLAINIASGLKSVSSDTHRPGFIVVETNYRIYAYTGGTFCVVVTS